MSFRDRFQTYVDRYPSFHQSAANKALHLVGIPTIILGIVWLLGSSHGIGLLALGFGSFFLWLGHRIEGNRPALTTNPIYLLVGPVWYLQQVRNWFRSSQS